jgi:ribosome-binding protein aMBF1 (putative translation factor)
MPYNVPDHSASRDTREEIDFNELIGNSARAQESFHTASFALEAAALVRKMRTLADGGEGISQAALADRLGISQARVSTIERGDGPAGPTFALLRRIANACGVQLSVIVESFTNAESQRSQYQPLQRDHQRDW